MTLKTLFIFALLTLLVVPFSLQAQDNKTVKGVLVLRKGYNKVGKELPGEGDFYLKYGKKVIFVKLTPEGLSRDELTPLLDTKLKFVIVEGNGLLDTDDPNQQSRIGDYVIVVSAK